MPPYGKCKTREPPPPFTNNTESLTKNHERLDQLRKSLWVTVLKQQKIVTLIRNEIPDSRDSSARNLIQDVTDRLRHRIDPTQSIIEGSFDHGIQLYKKHRK